tara:strand:- start:262 stop:879 length:618 start_codon:yes stop_codon:yes gene_type:complete
MNQFYGSGASNFYRRPGYSYGVPTGLGALLSGQQSPFGRMVDPATGFPRRSFPRPVMGRQDFGRIGRGKTGVGGASTVNPSRPNNVQVSDVFMEGVENAQLLGNNPPQTSVRQYTGSPPPMMDAGQYLRTGEIPSLSQGLPERPMFQTQGPESLMGEITQSPRFQAMQMGQAGGRRNIRPAMNVGKATGGPVGIHSGIASLVGRR